ncbi:nucleoside diphosphate kinase [Natronincola peptidivorans]|uniref:Nucleoside diphosphate kinase n=1 Tax=Natronincola peptidivorans TaxID=426128 RepID=A0A1I0DMT4_9FIRM|nr:nucleoside-diphosphate kinase [Natronincola peptidivorans]SET33808.1 nucleoside diphosphate kinase [Natronincola peptidivorans]
MQQSFVMIKSDGVQRGLVGEIISRFEKKGFILLEAKLATPSRATVEEHYAEHKGRPYFQELVDFILEGPVMAMVVEGENVIEVIRLMVGDKDPRKAMPGTIRGDFANTMTKNIIHASDAVDTAEREIKIWFSK